MGGDGNYVPAGKLGDVLNRNAFFNLLSERSNAFVAIKERATTVLKRKMVKDNMKAARAIDEHLVDEEVEYQQRLGAAILNRIYDTTRKEGIPLVVHVLPTRNEIPERQLIDRFPYEKFRSDRPGLLVVSMKPALDPFIGTVPLYWNQSHSHWTPFSHEQAGKAIARSILDAGFLR